MWLVRIFLHAVSYAVAIYLLNSSVEPAFKIAWLLLLLPFPLVGGSIFLLLRGQGLRNHRALKRMQISQQEGMHAPYESGLEVEYPKEMPYLAEGKLQIHYLAQEANCIGYHHCHTVYYPWGQEVVPEILTALRQAKSYIFLEFFLVAEGKFWGEILDVLKQKAREGVEIRLIYDGAGCFFSLPPDYPRYLATFGIQCSVFHPLYPVLSTRLNHRDHRKMLIVDGVWAVTGGINVSDEYINEKERFGLWKDSVLTVEGKAVWSMTVMFLTMWRYCTGEEESFFHFFPKKFPFFQETAIVLPYTNTILDHGAVGQAVFLNLISQAKRYIHITSPYLILDTASQTALCQAAKSGIQVQIITPNIPDKKLVFQVTRGFYPLLQESGVEIYQFTSGFIHGKTVVVDDVFATVGTVNLDFRSLFLHFENGVWLWQSETIAEIEQDFQHTLLESTLQERQSESSCSKLVSSILRIFSPLM